MKLSDVFTAQSRPTLLPEEWVPDSVPASGLFAVAIQRGVIETYREFDDGEIWDGPGEEHTAVRVLYVDPDESVVARREYRTEVTSNGQRVTYHEPPKFTAFLSHSDAVTESIDDEEFIEHYESVLEELYEKADVPKSDSVNESGKRRVQPPGFPRGDE